MRKVIRNLAVMLFLTVSSYLVNAQIISPLTGVKCSCDPDPNCSCSCVAEQNGCACVQKC